MLRYDAEEWDCRKTVVEGEIFVLLRNTTPSVVLFFWEPWGMSIKLLAIDFKGHDCLDWHIY
jgi:hypothetical protein